MVCTWYAHVTFVMATVPESAFQSSNLIGLVRSVVRATTHMHIYNVVGIIYITNSFEILWASFVMVYVTCA